VRLKRIGSRRGAPEQGTAMFAVVLSTVPGAVVQISVLPVLPELERDLGTNAIGVAWIVTAFLISAAVATPIVGRLGDMYGRRNALIVTLATMTAGCVVSAVGDSLAAVVVGRVLQGVGAGTLPVAFALAREGVGSHAGARRISVISGAAGIAGGVGLVIGGLAAEGGASAVFWCCAAAGAVSLVNVVLFVKDSGQRVPHRLDVLGAGLLAAGVTMLLLALSRAEPWGWGDVRTIALAGVGVGALLAMAATARRKPEPFVDVSLLTTRSLLVSHVAAALIGFAMFSVYVLTPQLAQAAPSTGYGLGLDAAAAGLLMLPGSVAWLLVVPVSSSLGARHGHRAPLALGGVLCAAGALVLVLTRASTVLAFVCVTVMLVGIACAYAALPVIVAEQVPDVQTGGATGVNVLVRSIGSSIGAQVTGAVLAASTTVAGGAPGASGMRLAYLLGAVAAVGVALTTFGMPRPGPRSLFAAQSAAHG
jgi:MFS family permease